MSVPIGEGSALNADSVLRQEKVVYVWNEPRPRVQVPDRLTLRSVRPPDRDLFLDTIEAVLHGSLDAFDKARLSRSAARDVAESYAEPDPKHFAYELDWWQIAYLGEHIVGFTQPVLFTGCAKEGREEGTLHFIGVLPEHRGNGYIVDLLSAATRVLQDVGVWRIYCDTDTRNAPMIEASRRVGYERGETKVVAHRLEIG